MRKKHHSNDKILRIHGTKKLFCLLVFSLFACCLLLGCSRSAGALDALLLEVNSAHQEIHNDGLKSSFRKRTPLNENYQLITLQERHTYFARKPEPYDPEAMLSQEQMAEDAAYLFDALYACYGNYEQMGGSTAFDSAEQAILAECAQKAPLRAEDFKELLLSHLKFVKDSHFTINDTDTNPSQIPFFFRETEFHKSEANQYATADGKTVAAVEGYSDLDALFRRSISPEGELVFYPVLQKDCLSTEAYASPQECGEQLTVHYTDGSTQVLEGEPYALSELLQDVDFDALPNMSDLDGIPVLQLNSFLGSASPDWQQGAQEGAKTLGASRIAILDLRFNPGGNTAAAMGWLEEYAKTPVPTNSLFFNGFASGETTDSRDVWVENENLLIILTSKRTASAAEQLIDAAYNLENVLIIGENTSGSMRGSRLDVRLEHSKLTVGAGMTQAIIPSSNDYFEEYRGFYPDLWVPAGEAEELTGRLIKQLS